MTKEGPPPLTPAQAEEIRNAVVDLMTAEAAKILKAAEDDHNAGRRPPTSAASREALVGALLKRLRTGGASPSRLH